METISIGTNIDGAKLFLILFLYDGGGTVTHTRCFRSPSLYWHRNFVSFSCSTFGWNVFFFVGAKRDGKRENRVVALNCAQ